MTAEGQEGSSLGNIRGKGGPGRGNSHCQNPKAGAAGRVHGPMCVCVFVRAGEGRGATITDRYVHQSVECQY